MLLALLAGAVLIGAALRGNMTARDVGTLFFWCGVGVLTLGIFSIGGTRARRGFAAQMAQTLDADTPGERSRRAGGDGAAICLAAAARAGGGLAMVIGTLLGA
ncbi:MAG: hypothetical protein R3A10_09590 [Caldilineaceae bacterium]